MVSVEFEHWYTRINTVIIMNVEWRFRFDDGVSHDMPESVSK